MSATAAGAQDVLRDVVRVLLAEDDPADARLLRATLATSPRRFELEEVTSVTEAIARLTQTPRPHVVLLDLSLPDSTGLVTLRRLLATESRVPVVVLTGLDDDRMAADAVEAGAQDYLVKGSVTGEVMARVLRHAVERHRLAHALGERVKEMAGVAAVSRLLQGDAPIEQACDQVAVLLVEAMQWPEVCRAEVRIDNEVGSAGPPRAPITTEALTAPVTVDGEERGRISVTYVQPARPFLLPFEQWLIEAFAGAVEGWLGRQDALGRLLSEEERLRLLVSQLPGAIWTTDSDLRVDSEAGAALTDLANESGTRVGMPLTELLESTGPDRLDPFRAALAGESRTFVHHWHGRWWRNHVGPKHDEAGTVIGTVCLTLDVSAEVEQRTELEQAHARFRGLFDSSLDAIFLADDDAHYVDVNPAACQLTGYTRDELLDMDVGDLAAPTAPNDGPQDAAAMWRHFLAEGTLSGEFALRCKNGSTVDVEFAAVADIAPGVHLSSHRDITARNRAERRLAASEARFRAMADAAQDAIYRARVEPEVAYDYLSPAAEEMSGFPVQAFHDDPGLFVSRVHPEDLARLQPGQLSEGRTTTVRFRFQRADGSWIWLEDRRSAIIEAGRTMGIQGVIRDTTTRVQTEQALRDALRAEQEAAERLRAVDELKSGFLQAVSHELRTPLTSVLGFARTLAGHADRLTADQVHDFHLRLIDNATRLDGLLTDLLDVERLNRGTVRLDLQPTDLTALVAEVAATVEFGDHACVIEETPAIAVVDAGKIERIVHNLLVNAVKHTPAGSTVWVACTTDGSTATITVADNGPGVPARDRDAVFDPFWQGHASHTAASPGTGIGLAVVRQFAALHGGRVGVEERSGGGAAFTVTLPAATTAPAAGAQASRYQRDASTREGELHFFETMRDTVAQLDVATDPSEATGIVLAFLERIGARLADPTDPDSLDMDLSIDGSQSLRAAAATGSPVRRRLQNHLPFLVDHARRTIARRSRPGNPLTDADIDPATGTMRAAALGRLLDGLHGHDSLAVVLLDTTGSPAPADELQVIRRLAGLGQRLSREGDEVVVTDRHELVLVLPDTPEDRAAALLDRLAAAWHAEPANPGHPQGAAVAITTGHAREALDRARQLARSTDRPSSEA